MLFFIVKQMYTLLTYGLVLCDTSLSAVVVIDLVFKFP